MKWINVDDKLPSEGQHVLCACPIDEDKEIWWFGCCMYHGFFPWIKWDNPAPVKFWVEIKKPVG